MAPKGEREEAPPMTRAMEETGARVEESAEDDDGGQG
jgi:hypothetical protein